MKKISIILLGVVLLMACKNATKDTKETIEIEVEKPTVTLEILDGGTVVANKLELFSEGDLYVGESKQFVDPIYIINHPNGRLIWDAGLPEGLVASPEPVTPPGGAFTISRKDSIGNQLKALNLAYDDFKYIALSHIHFDHTGSANYFKNASWLVQENEYDFITSDSIQKTQAIIYEPIKELTNVIKLNGDFDVFGDGTVIIKSTPGHTIGHQSLYLDLGFEKPILLTGDLYHFEENRESKVAPQFNYDIPQTKQSMEVFEAFAKEKNAEVIIQHSPKDLEKLKAILKS